MSQQQKQGMKLGDRKGSNSLLWLGTLWMQLPQDKAMAPQSPLQCHWDTTNGISLDLELQHCPLTQIPKIISEYQLTLKTQKKEFTCLAHQLNPKILE